MKSFDSRTYSINDFVEWSNNNQLEVSPRFQRRRVWVLKAKSYLMDSIIRGKPVPKFFIRQKINASTKASVREVVDGQQRISTILDFISDGFVISKKHNPIYGGKYFSQLEDSVQESILSYELSVDLLINLKDSEILDIFARLNSYSVTLNEQEKLNANHFSEFKLIVDELAFEYYNFWVKNKIFSQDQISRMYEVQITSDLVIGMIEGIKSKKQIKKYYSDYEISFTHDSENIKFMFNKTMGLISEIFRDGLDATEFRRPHIFYSLFISIYQHITTKGDSINFSSTRSKLLEIESIFRSDPENLNRDQRRFLEDSRRATTDEAVRKRRSAYISNLIS